MERTKIYWQWEQISKDTTLEIRDNVLAVGFINYSVKWAVNVNGFPIFPVPLVGTGLAIINSNMLWLPMNVGEIDVTQYKITFDLKINSPLATDKKQFIVWYKMTDLNA